MPCRGLWGLTLLLELLSLRQVLEGLPHHKLQSTYAISSVISDC